MDKILICLALAAFSFILFLLGELFVWLRNKIPKSVKCWFCHNKTQVEYKLSNNWYCSNCDQYNGFTKDGDYNRVINNQFEERLNFSVTSIGRSKDAWKSTNSLCEKCNRNQELKVLQLASFVPLNENNYDVEIEHYREQLEKCYKLCSECEGLLVKIFTYEKDFFSIPRRLVTALVTKKLEVNGIVRLILYMNLFVSMIISSLAYINLEGVPKFIKPYLQYNVNSTIPLWILNPKFLLPTGLVLNILAWIKTFSAELLLNSISWLILFLLYIFPSEYKHYIIALQAISGIISCGVSIICLTSSGNNLIKKTKNNFFYGKKFNSSQNSSNFSNFETYDFNNSQFSPRLSESTLNLGKSSPPSPPKTPTSTSDVIKPARNWSINNGIRGLNIGSKVAAMNTNHFNKHFSKRDTNNGKDNWWSNGMKNFTKRNPTQKTINPNISRPPSTSSSGFSDILDDVVDDYGICTGNSPICKHCHLNPSPLQYNCYYAAAYFQRLLYSTPNLSPSPQKSPDKFIQNQTNVNNNNLISILYTVPIVFLIISNLALLWTVYNHNIVKG